MTSRWIRALATALLAAPGACGGSGSDRAADDAVQDTRVAADTAAPDTADDDDAPDTGVDTTPRDADPHPLVNPRASDAARALHAALWDGFGEHILSGQTRRHLDAVVALVGAEPVVVAWDLAPYTEGYAWAWDHEAGTHTFGAVDDGTIDAVIAAWRDTGGCLIPTLQWHWHAPAGAQPGTNAFYSWLAEFDVRQAVAAGTTEHALILRDIDAIAAQLQRLEDADVPVLWRPLHEAGGIWFWWGLHGAEPALALWDIVYARLTEHHGLDNLIWVWSTPEATHYPGNDKLDVFGFDSYPGAYEYGCQKETYDAMVALTGGDKLVALTENGPVPDVDGCVDDNAMWAYFLTWAELAEEENTADHLRAMYAHERVITRAERCPP